jgi:hypothetical protein
VRCPPPGDERALLDLAAAQLGEPMPRSRPLWSATFVTGLAGGRTGLLVIMDHVLADGIAGLAVLGTLVASALWAKLGHSYLQHFLNLAGMRQTVLGPGGYWGLTQVTAHDETLLLRLLLTANTVLTGNSRAYALRLMAQVISSQRWGVPAGAPRSVTVHVKNGWLPRATHGWRINSIGGFTWSKGWYSIVVLSMDNPTMSYGITTVEAIARVIHRDLNPTAKTVIAPSAPNPAWGKPDELIPALPAIP